MSLTRFVSMGSFYEVTKSLEQCVRTLRRPQPIPVVFAESASTHPRSEQHSTACRSSFCCWRTISRVVASKSDTCLRTCQTASLSHDQPHILEFAECTDDDEWRYFITTSNYASTHSATPPASLKELLDTEVLKQATAAPQPVF